MPKLNAQVPEETRDVIRFIASEYHTTVQAVTALAVTLGLRQIKQLPAAKIRRQLQPDGRKQNGK